VLATVGVAIFGGFGQFIVTWLIAATGSVIAPPWYVIVCCGATPIALGAIVQTTSQRLSL
jgi:hypothetical protein